MTPICGRTAPALIALRVVELPARARILYGLGATLALALAHVSQGDREEIAALCHLREAYKLLAGQEMEHPHFWAEVQTMLLLSPKERDTILLVKPGFESLRERLVRSQDQAEIYQIFVEWDSAARAQTAEGGAA